MGSADKEEVEEGQTHPAPVPMRKDGFGGILACDDTITAVLGWKSSDLVGARSLDFIHPDDHDSTVVSWLEMLERPDSFVVLRYRHRHKDGSWIHVEVTNRNLLEGHGFVECSLVALGKAEGEASALGSGTSEIRAIHSIRSGERLLRRLADGLPTGVVYVASNGIVSYANTQSHLLLGVGDGAPITELFDLLDGDSAETATKHCRRIMGTDENIAITVSTGGSSSAPVRSLQIVLRGLADNAEGPAGIVMSVDDITDRIQAAAELEQRASTDPLTGCLNRSATFEALEKALGNDERLAVIFVDVDRMKVQNDLLGHAAGDALLVDTANRLRGAVRPGDVVGRIGGDEFVAVCRSVPTQEAAMMVAARIAQAMNWVFSSGSLRFPISASVGAVLADKSIDPAETVARADVAMYVAKRSADSRAVLWDESLRVGTYVTESR
ncbi:MAG: diguanylate cyclase domain-containing protein [Acidimicrobiales bacterium]